MSPPPKPYEPDNKLTLAFLKCDQLPSEAKKKRGTYEDVLHGLFEPLLPKRLSLETVAYDAIKRELPSESIARRVGHCRHYSGVRPSNGREGSESGQFGASGGGLFQLPRSVLTLHLIFTGEKELEDIDAIVISGSFEDDAHTDTTWILRLAGFLIMVKDNYPRIRIIGICFGLQIIARAFGPAKIVKNEKGW